MSAAVTSPSPVGPAASAKAALVDALPDLVTPLSEAEVQARLEQAAKRGKLAGFAPGTGEVLFTVSDFGQPFESVLEARRVAAATGSDSSSLRVRLQSRIKPLFPTIFALSLVLSVWPGWWLTDSLLRTYFSGYDIRTWIWYVPLTAPFCPWAFWSAMKKSRASAAQDLGEMIPKIAEIIGAPAEGPQSHDGQPDIATRA